MLDHHWAVPSKDRSTFSVDDEQQDSLNSDKVVIYFCHTNILNEKFWTRL